MGGGQAIMIDPSTGALSGASDPRKDGLALGYWQGSRLTAQGSGLNVWTRDYIIAAVGGQPDAQAGANRLMKNQEDQNGRLIRPLRRTRLRRSRTRYAVSRTGFW